MSEESQGIIEEYKSLRQEIAKRRETRLYVLGFTLIIIGVLISLTLGANPNISRGLDYYSLGLLSLALVVIIAALLMTTHDTQRKIIIASYIRKFIEPAVSGIQWESRWTQYLELSHSKSNAAGLPVDMSKALALSYGFLTIATYSIAFIIGLQKYWNALLLLTGLAIYSLACAIDLYMRISKGWKFNWDLIEKNKK